MLSSFFLFFYITTHSFNSSATPKYYPYLSTVFHVHYYHLYPSTMISCLFYCSTITGLPVFTLDLLQLIPNIFLKFKLNNVIALLSKYREEKTQLTNLIYKAPHNLALTNSPGSNNSKTKEVELAAQAGGELNLVFKTVEALSEKECA